MYRRGETKPIVVSEFTPVNGVNSDTPQNPHSSLWYLISAFYTNVADLVILHVRIYRACGVSKIKPITVCVKNSLCLYPKNLIADLLFRNLLGTGRNLLKKIKNHPFFIIIAKMTESFRICHNWDDFRNSHPY